MKFDMFDKVPFKVMGFMGMTILIMYVIAAIGVTLIINHFF